MLHHLRHHISVLFALGLTACSLDIPVENELTDPNAIASVQTAYEALSSAYTSYPKEEFRLSLLSDDFVPTFRAGLDQQVFLLYSLTDTQLAQLSEDLWSGYYTTIKDINAVITRLPALRAKLSEAEQHQLDYLRAEAQTLKALSYLQLLQLFATPYGDASHPAGIILKDRIEEEDLPRRSKEEVTRVIESLLVDAIATFSRSGTPAYGNASGFLNESAARVILARLYLYMGQWDKAIDATAPLIPPTMSTSLIPQGRMDWQSGEKSLAFLSCTALAEYYNGCYFGSKGVGSATYQLPTALYFSDSDLRRRSYTSDSTLIVDAQTSRTLQILGKYAGFIYSGGTPSQCYPIRSSEAIFQRVEAMARVGREEDARTLLNSYLRVVGADELPSTLAGGTLISAIMREKQREFVGEGLRFFDLKRLDLPIIHYSPNEARSIVFPITSYKRTLPIPASERTNPNIGGQNPGWPDLLKP